MHGGDVGLSALGDGARLDVGRMATSRYGLGEGGWVGEHALVRRCCVWERSVGVCLGCFLGGIWEVADLDELGS